MTRGSVVTFLAYGAALGLGLSAADVARANEADISKVMGAIYVAPGEHVGDVSTVNGSIHIGTDATAGRAKTVNGGIHVQGARVSGNIHTFNGGLDIGEGAEVGGDAANVNGGVHIAAAHIHGSVHTANAAIDLGPNAHIDGDVTVEADHSWHFGDDCPPSVVVAPGTVVKGALRFERQVRLYVSDRATIGLVEGAQPVKFAGHHPPEDCTHRNH